MDNYTLITGASSGIGYELAKEFGRNNHNLVIIARNKEKLEELANYLITKFKIKVIVVVADLTIDEDINKIFEMTKQLNINILCNNAGIGDYGTFLESDINKISKMLDLNIKSLIKLTYHYGNLMKKKKNGKILNIASIGSFVPGPMMACYYATKSFVLSFTESLSIELKKDNINVCACCPGPTSTNFFKNATNQDIDLLKSIKANSAQELAKLIYTNLMKNKIVYIPFLKNKLAVFGTRLISRKTLRKITNKIQNNRTK